MRGKIISRQKCPMCGRSGKYEAKELGRGRKELVCECGRFFSSRPVIRLWWDKKWWRISRDENGRRFRTYTHAERALGAINNQIENTVDPTRSGPQFRPEFWTTSKPRKLLWPNYVESYLESEARRLLPERKATYDARASRFRHTAWLNEYTIREINTAKLEDFSNLPCLKLALAPKTRADMLGEIRKLLRWAYSREDIDKVPQIPTVSVPRKKIKWLTPEQQYRVLECIPTVHRPVFMFLMEFGVRPAAACALCWDHVDTDKMEFVIGRTFSRRLLIDTTKTRTPHTLPIFGWFQIYLEGVTRGIGKTPVFRNQDCDPNRNPDSFYYPEFLTDRWSAAVQAAGLEEISLYNGTKHSRGHQLRRQGWDYDSLGALFGISAQQVRRSYVGDDPEMIRKKMQATVTKLPT